MKKMNLNSFIAVVILLVGSLMLFNACPNEPKQKPKPTQYNVDVQQSGGGAIAADPLKAEAGEYITLTAAADNNYRFNGFTVSSDDGPIDLESGSGTTRIFKMPAANVTVTASFLKNDNITPPDVFDIILVQPEFGGTISSSETEAAAGVTITLTAAADPGFRFNGFTVNSANGSVTLSGSSTSTTRTFKMPAGDVTVTASFIPVFTITLVQPNSGGTINANKTEASEGETITITAVPAKDFLLEAIIVSPEPADLVVSNNRVTFTVTENVTVTVNFMSLGEIEFSHTPGVYEAAFDLTVSFPANPNAVIYWSLDGTEPVPGSPVTRNNNIVTGSVLPGNKINVAARTKGRDATVLTRFYNTWSRKANQGPANGSQILTGNAYRFRAFVDDKPVSETVIASYFIIPGAATKYDNNPIISINAPYQPFYDLYAAADRFNPPDNSIGRQDFNYEYFALEGGSYKRQFSLLGSTSLGASWTRDNAQRTFNVHFRRGSLNGTITYPIFEGSRPEGIYRFRLWSGGNNFVGPRDWSMGSDHFRDAFVQKASAQLNVPYSEWNLAILFIDGEYWGFTQLRQQTDNAAFAEDRLGMEASNIVIMDRGAQQLPGQSWSYYVDLVEEGDTTVAGNLYSQLESFVTANLSSGTPSDTVVSDLFNTYIAKDNFIDYLIVGTFFNSTDWPQNNVRFWRAITPKNDGNPNNDGRWRFTLHDLDQAANGITWGGPGSFNGSNYADGSRFSNLINATIGVSDGGGPPFNRVWKVLNNKNFVDEFTQRALYVMDEYFDPAKTGPLYDDWLARFTPLLTDMYERWAINSGDNVTNAYNNTRNSFNLTTSNVKFFLNNRRSFYLSQLNALRSNVGLGNL